MFSYKIGVVSYLNARPFLYGLRNSPLSGHHQILVESPSRIAELLLKQEIDLGLVPVYIIHKMIEHHLVTEYCIGSDDKVCSVCLYSDTPLDECHTVLLDSESRTSAVLAKILMKHHFKMEADYKQSFSGYENALVDGTAGLVIGDRALMLSDRYRYVYDLGAEWKKMTGLPFVFAAWISNKKLDSDFIKQFNEACTDGINQRAKIADTLVDHYQGIDVGQYFSDCISYNFDNAKRKGLKLFLEYSKLL